MDRQIAFAVLFAIVSTGLIGLFYFTAPAQSNKPVYSPDDIRYALQQKDAKNAKRKKSVSAAPAHIPDADESVSESINEEPPAEEPPLD